MNKTVKGHFKVEFPKIILKIWLFCLLSDLIFPNVFFHLRALTNESQQNFFNRNCSVKSFKNPIKLGVHRRRTGRLWPSLVVHCCRALRHEITGGALTSGHCCQRTDLVPALPRPCLVVSELQPLGLPVTLALPDILNPCQCGNQAQTWRGERSPSPACYLPFPFAPINMQSNHTPERSDTRRPAHMCRKIYFLIFLLATRGIVGMKVDKRFRFLHMKSPRFFCLCALVCRATSRFLLISISYFPGCADGFDSGPDHMIALASNARIHKEIGRGLRYSIWPSHWWNSIYLSLENVIIRNRTPLKIL